jgi:hypothetical protein
LHIGFAEGALQSPDLSKQFKLSGAVLIVPAVQAAPTSLDEAALPVADCLAGNAGGTGGFGGRGFPRQNRQDNICLRFGWQRRWAWHCFLSFDR